MIEYYCKVNETPIRRIPDCTIACKLAICYWNIGLEYLPDNCACKEINISEGAECLSFISKIEAERRLNRAMK